MTGITIFAHALADTTRWRILQLVADGPVCVCELADILQMPQSSVSSHLQVIKKAGMLDSERCEKWIYYRLSPAHRRLLLTLSGFFEPTPSDAATLREDAARAAERLAEREGSCCPLPRELAALKPEGLKTTGGSKSGSGSPSTPRPAPSLTSRTS